MTPTLVVLLITGGRLPEPALTLHTRREQARTELARQARELLREQLEFVPLWAQVEHPDDAQAAALIDGLYGLGWRVLLDERPVELA